jgi:hypothetical protein
MKEQIAALLKECESNADLKRDFGSRLDASLSRVGGDSPAAQDLDAARKLVEEIEAARSRWAKAGEATSTGATPQKDASLVALHVAADVTPPVLAQPTTGQAATGKAGPVFTARQPSPKTGPSLAERQATGLMAKLRPKFEELRNTRQLLPAGVYDALAARVAQAEKSFQANDFAKVVDGKSDDGKKMGNVLVADVEKALQSRKTERYEDVYRRLEPGHATLDGDAATLRKYAADDKLKAYASANAEAAKELEDALHAVAGYAKAGAELSGDEREAEFQRAVEGEERIDAAAAAARKLSSDMNKKLKQIEDAAALKERQEKLAAFFKEPARNIAATVARVESGNPADLRTALAMLQPTAGTEELQGDMKQARIDLVSQALSSPKARDSLARMPGVATSVVLEAEGLGVLAPVMLDGFGPKAPEMCRTFAIEIAKRKPKASSQEGDKDAKAVPPPVLETWVWKNAKPDDWNQRENGTSAQVYNSLWNARNFEQMAEMIGRGFDAGQAFNTEKDEGRGSREGVWSGFVQPLEHLLGHYVKRVHLAAQPLDKLSDEDRAAIGEPSQALEARMGEVKKTGELLAELGRKRDALLPEQAEERRKIDETVSKLKAVALTHEESETLKNLEGLKAKVAGARQILKALETAKGTSIATSYETILKSPAVELMKKDFGTIWGFEDVRLPYVQAAREATPHGSKPLRMWEMWKAIDHAINKEGYDRLLNDPDAAIPDYLAKGRAALDDEIRKNPELYRGADVDAFKANFEKQAGTYLQHLATMTPKGEFETAEMSGIAPTKLMGGLGCKAGLWWAKEEGEKVYYCLDGLRMEQAVDYKRQKNDAINNHLLLDGPLHLEVITFAEIREILKHWNELSSTVIFLRKGKTVPVKEVEEWIALMTANDQKTTKRPAPRKQKLETGLNALSPHLLDDDDVTDQIGLKMVIKGNALVRIAKMKAEAPLVPFLTNKCALLYRFGVLPSGLGDAYASMLAAQEPTQRSKHRETVVGLVNLIASATIKDALKARVERAG